MPIPLLGASADPVNAYGFHGSGPSCELVGGASTIDFTDIPQRQSSPAQNLWSPRHLRFKCRVKTDGSGSGDNYKWGVRFNGISDAVYDYQFMAVLANNTVGAGSYTGENAILLVDPNTSLHEPLGLISTTGEWTFAIIDIAYPEPIAGSASSFGLTAAVTGLYDGSGNPCSLWVGGQMRASEGVTALSRVTFIVGSGNFHSESRIQLVCEG